MSINIQIDKIHLDVTVYEGEIEKYGIDGLKTLLQNIVERYFHKEYFEPELVKEILEEKTEDIIENTEEKKLRKSK